MRKVILVIIWLVVNSALAQASEKSTVWTYGTATFVDLSKSSPAAAVQSPFLEMVMARTTDPSSGYIFEDVCSRKPPAMKDGKLQTLPGKRESEYIVIGSNNTVSNITDVPPDSKDTPCNSGTGIVRGELTH